MKVELFLQAETEADEEQLDIWASIHLQTHLQDFLEDELTDLNIGQVNLPNMTYVARDGSVIAKVRQGD